MEVRILLGARAGTRELTEGDLGGSFPSYGACENVESRTPPCTFGTVHAQRVRNEVDLCHQRVGLSTWGRSSVGRALPGLAATTRPVHSSKRDPYGRPIVVVSW